ncbi:hypothetical protein GFS31_31660 [Leptolyngbya sp. BL0902]|nr:hypothetical protein GFS31_31660 [Leptolyngbya sp. BL0902]
MGSNLFYRELFADWVFSASPSRQNTCLDRKQVPETLWRIT